MGQCAKVDPFTRIVEEAGHSRADFDFAIREKGWITVRHGDIARRYRLDAETGARIAADIRTGIFTSHARIHNGLLPRCAWPVVAG
jgi:hypothetical protein